jgi:cytoskeletal protein CcmA (bactofilin family)
MKEKEFQNFNFTMLGKDSILDGDFKFSGDTLINCHITGSITMINDGKLTFERDSKFEGSIFCHDIEVFGDVKGTLNASGVLSVRSSAIVSGVINAKSLSIFPGANINIEGHTEEEKTSPEQTSLS